MILVHVWAGGQLVAMEGHGCQQSRTKESGARCASFPPADRYPADQARLFVASLCLCIHFPRISSCSFFTNICTPPEILLQLCTLSPSYQTTFSCFQIWVSVCMQTPLYLCVVVLSIDRVLAFLVESVYPAFGILSTLR